MATLKNADYIYEIMRDKKLPYWKVSVGGDVINSNDETNNIEDSILKLTSCLSAIDRATAKVVIRPKTGTELNDGGGSKTNVFTYLIECKNGAETINGTGTPINLEMLKQHEELIRQNEALKHQSAIDNLQAQINGLLNKEDDEDEEITTKSILNETLIDLIDEAKPYLPAIIGKLFNVELPMKAPATVIADNVSETKVSTATTDKTPEQIEQIKKAGRAGQKLEKIDPYFGDRLLLLAELAELAPDQYKMGCAFVESSVNSLKNTDDV